MNMLATIAPKSNQLNADDLIGGPMTIQITRVKIDPGSDQPVAIHFEGDNGKPYMACKSMRRVLVTAWGADASAYVGRSMTIYRDPTVAFGGMQVGGIRISHMSDIPRSMTMALTASKASRKPYTVEPLKVERPAQTKGWRIISPADWSVVTLSPAKWPEGVKRALAQMADPGDLSRWREAMAEHMAAVPEAERQAATDAAQDRMDELAGANGGEG